MNTKIIRERLENLIDESKNKTLKETQAIKHIGVDDDRGIVVLIIKIGVLGSDAEKNLRHQIAKIIKLELGFKGVKIQFEEDKKPINKDLKFIIISSCKGGVGKSTIAVNLAYALSRQGKKVGIIDADIYGATVPDLLEMEIKEPDVDDNGKFIPYKKHNIEVVSTEFFAERDKPILWRGSQLKSLVSSFFTQVAWSRDLEFIIIDAPSGTGDIMLDLKSIVPSAEVILATTPHPIDAHMTIKTGLAYRELKHNIIGIIENMAYYLNPETNTKDYIFLNGGAEEAATKLNTEILASFPINTPKHHLALYESDEENGQLYNDLATLISIR